MSLKNTFLLLLVTLLLAGGYYYAQKHVPGTDEVSAKQKRVVDLKSADVLELEIKGVDRAFLFEKKDQAWFFKKPLQVRASASEIEAILAGIEFLESRRRLSSRDLAEAKRTLSDYGLEKPRLVASLKTKQGVVILNVGNESRQGDGLYVQIAGDSHVYLVGKDIATKLDKKLEDYRERGLFDFTSAQVNRFEIKNGAKLMEIAKTNNAWRVLQPLNARADETVVEDFIHQSIGLRAEDFLSEDPAASKEYGLEDAAQTLTLKLDQHDAVHSLLVGTKLKNNNQKAAAKVKGENSIVSIPVSYQVAISRPLNDFRDHNLMSFFGPEDVLEVEIKNRQNLLMLQREEKNWKVQQPEKQDADKEVVERFLSKLNSLKIKEFSTDVLTDLDKFGLKPPLLSTIVIRGKSKETSNSGTNQTSTVFLDLAIGREDPVKKLVYVKRADESSVYGIDLADMADFPRSVLEVQSRKLFEIKKETLRLCTQKKGKALISLEQGGDAKWKVSDGSQGVLNETAWLKFQNQLEHFTVEKIIGTALNPTIKQYGLENPLLTWTVKTEIDGKPVSYEVLLGHETPQKKYYILWKDRLLVCEVSAEMYQNLAAEWLNKPATK